MACTLLKALHVPSAFLVACQRFPSEVITTSCTVLESVGGVGTTVPVTGGVTPDPVTDGVTPGPVTDGVVLGECAREMPVEKPKGEGELANGQKWICGLAINGTTTNSTKMTILNSIPRFERLPLLCSKRGETSEGIFRGILAWQELQNSGVSSSRSLSHFTHCFFKK
jgi:hypothetical protein